MKNFKVLKTTDNPTVYKKTFNNYIGSCPMCSPNKGCNAYHKYERKGWKDQTTKRKQWM